MTTKQGAIPNPASPTASSTIPTTPAPGLRGKGSTLMGMAPRQSFAPVNSMAPPAPMAGAMDQKSVPPPNPRMPMPAAPATPMTKMNSAKGNEVDMATAMGTRPLRLQDMLKISMADSAMKVNASLEAARQEDVTEKVAEKKSDGPIDHEYALKLASAIEYVAEEFGKEAQVGEGPNHLEVMESNVGGEQPFKPGNQGHGHSQVPTHTPMQASMPGGPKTQLENDKDHAPGGPGHQTTALSGGKGKTAAAKIRSAFKKVAEDEKLEKEESKGMDAAKAGLEKAEKAHEKEEKKEGSANPLVNYMRQKIAEDAINPAHISAGPAVAPVTMESGEAPKEQPAGGAPQGPTGLIASNASAADYKKSQSHGPRRSELKAYFNEPALTMSTDRTLAEAFTHTGEAGTKFASAGVGTGTKVAAARAVLSKLAEEAEENKSVKDKGEEKKEKVNGASH